MRQPKMKNLSHGRFLLAPPSHWTQYLFGSPAVGCTMFVSTRATLTAPSLRPLAADPVAVGQGFT